MVDFVIGYLVGAFSRKARTWTLTIGVLLLTALVIALHVANII